MKALPPATAQSFHRAVALGHHRHGNLACAVQRRPHLSTAGSHRLRGDALVLLGEVHDNAQQHQTPAGRSAARIRIRVAPAIAMEQFDREHQADIDRARRERPAMLST
jgi:hypothetical protein